MSITVKQISSLEKVRPCGIGNVKSINRAILLGGERFSYQIAIETEANREFKIDISSPLKEYIKVYAVKNVVMDYPTENNPDEDLITKEPGLMPDLLLPIEDEGNVIRLEKEAGAVWLDVHVPVDFEPGQYTVETSVSRRTSGEAVEIKKIMTLDVIGVNIPKQRTKFTQWFYADCIADIHNVEIYSEEHWGLIDKYMALASDLGVNMMLTPIISPPLDTAFGITRPCTQLVKIFKDGDSYSFDFTLLKRWVELCTKNGIEYFEMSHLFSQWGLKYAPNIKICENGEEGYLFGWGTAADSKEYKNFLNQFIPALVDFCKAEGIKDRCWFHISDEPNLVHLSSYKYAHDVIKPLIDGCPTLDAISCYDFYEKGLVQIPVTVSSEMHQFLGKNVPNQWVYYCGNPHDDTGNRFLSMPSYRNRILGLQMYKFGIEGFLHWGYNFYYSENSRKKINPYLTTSADKGFPSGDSFSVYPVNNGAAPSLRAVIFREALYDIEICRMLEEIIGREKVVEMIDNAAMMDITFEKYPRNSDYIPDLINAMKKIIKNHTERMS